MGIMQKIGESKTARAFGGLAALVGIGGPAASAVHDHVISHDTPQSEYRMSASELAKLKMAKGIDTILAPLRINDAYAGDCSNARDYEVMSDRMWDLIQDKQYMKVINKYGKFASNPCNDNAAFYGCMGLALKGIGDLDKAIIMYEKSLSLDPENKFSHYNLGIALAKTGRCDEAISHFDYRLKVEPGHKGATAWKNHCLGN